MKLNWISATFDFVKIIVYIVFALAAYSHQPRWFSYVLGLTAFFMSLIDTAKYEKGEER